MSQKYQCKLITSTAKEKKNQRRPIRREFEPVCPTMLKKMLDAVWGLLPTLRWVNSCL